MNEQFIDAIKQTATYRRQDGTATSYYWASGSKLLPNRISISREEMRETRHTGRNPLHKIVGQIMGTFKKDESSPLKLNKPFQLRTNIWTVPSFPTFIGYGTIGISNLVGKIDRQSDTGDLVVLQTATLDWQNITIYYFAGNIMNLELIMEYLYKSQNK